MSRPTDPDATMAVFLDLENIALGAKDAKFPRFAISKVLERLLLKGHIVVKKAYCDFDRYKEFKRDLHEAAFELIEIPHVRQSGKNSADIRMVVDALDLCYTKQHVDTFVILSGDSDFSPLVSKLRENAKTVIGVGVKNSSSDLFINNCDEFIYYDALVRESRPVERSPRPPAGKTPAKKVTRVSKTGTGRAAPNGAATEPEADIMAGAPAATPLQAEGSFDEVIDLIRRTLDAIREERGGDDRIWGSFVKQTIKRQRPGFNERYYGFRSFNEILLEASRRGLLKVEHDPKSGGYVITPGQPDDPDDDDIPF